MVRAPRAARLERRGLAPLYVDQLGFSVPWRVGAEGHADVAQVDRQGCALILSEHWPAKVGKGPMFISLNVEPETHANEVAPSSKPEVLRSRTDIGGIAC